MVSLIIAALIAFSYPLDAINGVTYINWTNYLEIDRTVVRNVGNGVCPVASDEAVDPALTGASVKVPGNASPTCLLKAGDVLYLDQYKGAALVNTLGPFTVRYTMYQVWVPVMRE